jgi:hypothetical protein
LEQKKRQKFNILSIEGNGIRAIIPATSIHELERYAYTYGLEKKYKKIVEREKSPAYPNKRI